MTEVDHYAAAVSSVEQARGCGSDDPLVPQFLATAQVHATLALVDVIRALARPTPVPALTVTCDCAELSPLGSGCWNCGHLASFHEAQNGPCTVIEGAS